MPGLVGIIHRTSEHNVKSEFELLLASMRCNSHLRSESCVAPDGRWALGRVHLGILQPTSQVDENSDIQAFLHGDLWNEAELRTLPEIQDTSWSGKRAGVLLASLYRAYGKSFISRLRGAFCAAILDKKAKQLVLVNDRLGSYFLYWFHGPQHFVFASELSAVLRHATVKPTLNPRAVADYLTFGFLFGDKTLATPVRLLPPASMLTYYWEDGHYTLDRYWRADVAFQPWEGSKSSYLEALRETFNLAVQRTLEEGHSFGLSLSGGLDSRMILSAIDCTRASISTYTLGVQGCADEVIAQQLAQIAGTKHRFLELDMTYLGDALTNLQRMVALADGMYLTHGLTEMLALRFLETAGFSVLLRGHGGELAKASLSWPLHTDERIYNMQGKDEFVSYMLDRVNYISRRTSLRKLFTDGWFLQIDGQARLSLEDSIADVQLSLPDLCSYLYLTEHHRRFTGSSLELFRSMVEVRMPFVDEDFLELLFRSPARWREGTDIHRAVIGANCPALLKVRNSNTGAPGSASPLVEKILDRMNSLFRRLNLYGYRHYHSFERWMKQLLLDSVEQVLLQPECLSKSMYREETLRRLIEEMRRGVADHAYLLQVLLILELWQRENL
jgi:asparagine synthase (glutamine-hydrolysing)